MNRQCVFQSEPFEFSPQPEYEPEYGFEMGEWESEAPSSSEVFGVWQGELDRSDTFTVLPTGGAAPFKDWVWPMPVWNGRQPVISNGFDPSPSPDPRFVKKHAGVDIMYKRLPGESAKLPEGTRHYFVPSNRIPVFAVGSGVVVQSGKNLLGHSVIIDHGNGYSTFYQHLTAQGLPRKSARVAAGTPIGFVGHNPAGYRLNHLHFEIWLGPRKSTSAMDPAPVLRGLVRRPDAKLPSSNGGATPAPGSRTTPSSGSGAATPAQVKDALDRKQWSEAIRQAIQRGVRDESRLTDLVFHARHPELKGRRLRGDERPLVQEWLDIRDRLVRPALAASPAGRPPGAPATPSRPSTATPSWVRTVVPLLEKYRGDIPLDFLLGWIAVESSGRLGTVTQSLNERGYFQNHPGESKTLKLDHDRLSRDPDYSVQGGIALVRYGARQAQALGFTYGSELSWAYAKLRHWLPLGIKVLLEDMKKRGFKPATWNDFRTYVLRNQQRLDEAIKNEYIRHRPHLRSWTLPPKWHSKHGIEVVDRVFKRGRELAAGLANSSSTELQLEPFRFEFPSRDAFEAELSDGMELESGAGSCPNVPVPASRRPRVLVRGSKHSAVREAQRKLNAFHAYRLAAGQSGLRDAPLAEDCIFGKHTYEAVKSFQELVFPGMPVEHDGKIGTKTWAQLDAIAVGPEPARLPSSPSSRSASRTMAVHALCVGMT